MGDEHFPLDRRLDHLFTNGHWAGAIWSWCEFPYGDRTSVPLPVLEVAWAFDAPWR